MKIMIIDDEEMALEDLCDIVTELKPNAEIDCFNNYIDALKQCNEKIYNIAFLDISMPQKNGIELAIDLKNINPEINIIYVTGYSEYAVEAFSLYASGYILKPARTSDVKNSLENLRFPIKYKKNKLQAQCFGNFEVFINNEIIRFKRTVTKELLAYLIYLKGATTNTNELCAVLFDNDSISNKKYLRILIADLRKTLQEYNLQNVFIGKRNSFSVNINEIECDYYKLLESDVAAINSYQGNFMSQYSWAETLNGYLYSNYFRK